ncbi:MAG: hypothetical protein CVV56_08495 [Tenericutes bacterium HGW-Tenericutes-1]|jgi:hypothetical protein|nr:MAG: hypothetical protein CVV58_00015 [Tenericutes bacterium HGW-Tenericutes-3]PKK99981.1 MAG: hypothetical protein CVV56_08495 [Tenericutes bacterium HGW-Tenericutes-1]
MFKKVLLFFVIVFSFIGLIGCSEAYDGSLSNEDYYSDANGSGVIILADDTTPERKILYTVDISFDVNDLIEAEDFLNTLIASDEWFDSENLTSTRYTFKIRIKTDRLDDFITALKEEFALRTYQKEGKDISLQYQDTTNKILSLEAQLERLLELYDQATLSEMIIINEQISDIEVELQNLNGTLNQFDSLAEYSVVNLVFYGSAVTSDSPFINRLGNAFVNGFNGLVSFFDGLLIIIATVVPFAVVIGVVGTVTIIIYKKSNKKRLNTKKPNSEEK